MKKVMNIALMALVMVSCNQKNKEGATSNSEATESVKHEHDEQMYACSMHPEVTGHKGDKCSKCGMELSVPVANTEAHHDGDEHSDADHHEDEDHHSAAAEAAAAPSGKNDFSMAAVTDNYLKIKNALTKDDANGAAEAGKALYQVFINVNPNSVDGKSKKEYMDIADDAKEHAEHIGANASKIDHQREHFVMLSKDINDLIKIFGTKQKLYQDYCPMADEGKGAIWISETKEIKNPYMGSKMPTCGTIKKQF